MTRGQQLEKNRVVICEVEALIAACYFRLPSYAKVVAALNRNSLTTSRGNAWTSKRLIRMLQRHGIGGLHGLKVCMERHDNNRTQCAE